MRGGVRALAMLTLPCNSSGICSIHSSFLRSSHVVCVCVCVTFRWNWVENTPGLLIFEDQDASMIYHASLPKESKGYIHPQNYDCFLVVVAVAVVVVVVASYTLTPTTKLA